MEKTTQTPVDELLTKYGPVVGVANLRSMTDGTLLEKSYALIKGTDGWVLLKVITRQGEPNPVFFIAMEWKTRSEMCLWLRDYKDRWYANALALTLRNPLTLEPDA